MARRRTAFLRLAAAAAAGTGIVATAVPAAGAPPSRVPLRTAPPAVASGEVTVILRLAGRPVAAQEVVVMGGPGRATWARARFRAGLIARQRRLVPALRARGATVVTAYRDAFNGVAVRVPAGRVASLRALPGVVGVHRSRPVRRTLVSAVPFTGIPEVWEDAGLTGRGIRIGVVDGGVDHHHAALGGSGDPADFAADAGTDPAASGFPTAKVAGGHDFVGDAFDPTDPATATPEPDPVPLDCDGHGTHVAGIAAGTGVREDGTAYPGPYTAGAVGAEAFRVGPGVAPEATVFAYRVFSCAGWTEDALVLDAIDRAVRDRVDVLNLSLGAPFQGAAEPVSVAVETATRAGVTVVTSAGNEGPGAYTAGAPAAASGAITVGAADTVPDHTAATLTGPALPALTVQETTDAVIPAGGVTGTLAVTGDPALLAAGCDAAELPGPGAIPVVILGVCDHRTKALAAQDAGAPAVILVSNDAGYADHDGPMPDVTIPVLVATADQLDALRAADGTEVTVTAAPRLANPFFRRTAPWSSAGPRWDDAALKPDLLAPGVQIRSAGAGTGTEPLTATGTSMSAPYAAGAAALLRQARPAWRPADVKAALTGTASADPADLRDADVLTAGAGLLRPRLAVRATVRAVTADRLGNLSFGYRSVNGPISETRRFRLVNDGPAPVTYALAARADGDAHGADLRLSRTRVTVPARGSATVSLTIALSRSDVAALPGATAGLTAVRGAVVATPAASRPGAYPLRVPFLLVPAGRSGVDADDARVRTLPGGDRRVSVDVENDGVHGTRVRTFAWGLADPAGDGAPTVDVRAVGVQAPPAAATAGVPSLVFAITLHRGLPNAARTEFDVSIDADSDGTADVLLVGADAGLVDVGAWNGRLQAFVLDASGAFVDRLDATAPPNGATVLLPVPLRHLGPLDADSEITYGVNVIDTLTGEEDAVDGTARFRPLTPAVETGTSVPVVAGEDRTLTLAAAPRSASDPLGWMLVALDDPAGIGQANTVRLPGGR